MEKELIILENEYFELKGIKNVNCTDRTMLRYKMNENYNRKYEETLELCIENLKKEIEKCKSVKVVKSESKSKILSRDEVEAMYGGWALEQYNEYKYKC